MPGHRRRGDDPHIAETTNREAPKREPSRTRQIVVRIVLLLLAGVSLYLLLPSIVQVFSSWPQLRKLHPLWMLGAAGFETVSFMAVWTLQRIALRSRSWFAVGTSQLTANAAGTVVPGGGAAAGAAQYSMLVRAGVPPASVASALTATAAASTGAVLALPVFAAVAAIGGAAMPKQLQHVAFIGGGAFVLLAAGAVLAFASDRPLLLVGRGIRGAAGWVRQRDRVAALPERLLRERDAIRAAFSAHPVLALLAALGKWGFDFLVLVCVLEALGVEPDSALLLLAYAASMVLGLIPLTPGGLGFVEAGLTGMLVLAGVGGADAAVATLAYRLVAFWLPLPVGLGAWLLFRHRYSGATSSSS
jgi:uncharacterized protein (TIRG00374 family)